MTRPGNPDVSFGERINQYRNRFLAWFYIFRIGRNNLRRPGVHPDIEMGQFNPDGTPRGPGLPSASFMIFLMVFAVGIVAIIVHFVVE